MRVYLPTTLTELARILRDQAFGEMTPASYAVTPALREWYASGDLEELEYAAMADAAKASLRLLAADPGAPSRRVVLAAEVPDELVAYGSGDIAAEERAVVKLSGAIPFEWVVSGHVDDAEAEPDVRAARAAVFAADAGDDDARFTVDGAAGHDLLWYATQELPHLLA
jgi:hypothetical protein